MRPSALDFESYGYEDYRFRIHSYLNTYRLNNNNYDSMRYFVRVWEPESQNDKGKYGIEAVCGKSAEDKHDPRYGK